jgi:hypothetical protein
VASTILDIEENADYGRGQLSNLVEVDDVHLKVKVFAVDSVFRGGVEVELARDVGLYSEFRVSQDQVAASQINLKFAGPESHFHWCC